jgi:hypothetical protein
VKQTDIKVMHFQLWTRITKHGKGARFSETYFQFFSPNGVTLTKEKLKDLLDLYQYIPLVLHPFYEELNGSDNVEHTNLQVNSDPDDGPYPAVPVCGTCQSFGDTEVAV